VIFHLNWGKTRRVSTEIYGGFFHALKIEEQATNRFRGKDGYYPTSLDPLILPEDLTQRVRDLTKGGRSAHTVHDQRNQVRRTFRRHLSEPLTPPARRPRFALYGKPKRESADPLPLRRLS